MIKIAALVLSVLTAAITASAQGQSWIIQLEEPTGIERRDNEVVRYLASFAAGQARAEQIRILDEASREIPVQVVIAESFADGTIKTAEVLFPATLIPGQLPRYRLLVSPLMAPV